MANNLFWNYSSICSTGDTREVRASYVKVSSYLLDAVNSLQQDDWAKTDLRDELKGYLSVPVEKTDNVLFWWGHCVIHPTLRLWHATIYPSRDRRPPAFFSRSLTGTKLRNKLTPEVFEALQLLKSAYRNGRISAAKDAAKHMDTLIAELDEEHYGFPPDVVDMMELDGDEYIIDHCVMVPPSLLFASYRAEISFDLNISSITLPGIAIAGKLVVAQISEELVILMVGIIGHEEPLLSLVDWSEMKIEVEASTRSVMMSFVNWTASGTLLRTSTGIQNCQTSVFLRIALEDQAAFWAFAYLMVKPSSAFVHELAFSLENQQHITRMFEFFTNDHGQEFPGGEGASDMAENQDPPGYDEHK
ncbi:hypothetical protein C8R44DRAFT_876216 [Mycena epipterygia]|nr:hypothetical protein C8R44DRAFT_876216 [Mycena epipterygia]